MFDTTRAAVAFRLILLFVATALPAVAQSDHQVADQQAWTAFARAMLRTNEFLYID